MDLDVLIHGLNARRVGSRWMAKCPAHEDRRPSLSIGARSGKVLVHCHAGCSQSELIGALKARGLWSPDAQVSQSPRRIVAEYDYTDANGSLLYQIVRFEPKDFRQRHPNGLGGWTWKKHPNQVLYRLGEVLEAPIVFVVEGEADVEALRSHGFVATTNAGGAHAPWLPQYTESLSGREVILIPDADLPGRKRVVRIARALLGAAARIVVWEPEDAKDIRDWFLRGHGETELISQLDTEGVTR